MAKLREGCLPEERKKLMSYLSLYEPDTLHGKSKPEDERRRNRSSSSSDARGGKYHQQQGGGEKDQADDDSEDVVWDFSNHGREELQHELTRYLRKHRLDQTDEGGAGKASKWSKGVLAKGNSRKKSAKSSKFEAERAQLREERARKLERRRELEQRQREFEEGQEQERLLRPIPVGNGAGSAVIGDLEPKPNSREAYQLEHISRLLWDGEDEPEDFALTYGKRQ